jgi:hypothetical protein
METLYFCIEVRQRKQPISKQTQKKQNKTKNGKTWNKLFVSDSAETSFGSSFRCFEPKLVSKNTLEQIYKKSKELDLN